LQEEDFIRSFKAWVFLKIETSSLVVSTYKPKSADVLPLISKQALYLNILEEAEFTNNFIEAVKTLYLLISIHISKVWNRHPLVGSEIEFGMMDFILCLMCAGISLDGNKSSLCGCRVAGTVHVLWTVETVNDNDEHFGVTLIHFAPFSGVYLDVLVANKISEEDF
ncbi:hypothetical protein MKW98_029639, partial [Papaver atlanticum]